MSINIKKTEWNFTPLFAGDDDPKIEIVKKEVLEKNNAFVKKWKGRTDYLESPAVLKEALDEYEVLRSSYGTDGGVAYYFDLRSATDLANPTLKAKLNLVEDASTKILNEIQFFELTISKIKKALQPKFLASPELLPYRHFLERLFTEAEFLLSDAEEKILNLKSGPAHEAWERMTSSFISKEERDVVGEDGMAVKKNFSEILGLVDSLNKKTRDSAAESLNDIFRKHIEVGEAEINALMRDKKINDELRNMQRPDLARHIADDIESPVVDALIASVAGRFDIAQRFYKLKAKLLGVPRIAYHERGLPYGTVEAEYPYEKAIDLVYDVFTDLDPKFADILKRFSENGQIDAFPKKGKRSGAFCAYHLLTNPTYVFLNHTGRLRDVLTLAHEMGHGINDEFFKEKQNALNAGTPLSTAEVASTFMEDFVLEHLLKEVNDEERLSIMMTKLGDDVSSIFRQAAFYRFETELHGTFREKGYLSKDEIGAIFQKNMVSYMGDYVEQSLGSENWWLYVSHFRVFFYVYSYVSGLLISKSMQKMVRENKKDIEKVKNFLSTGRSDSPKNIFA